MIEQYAALGGDDWLTEVPMRIACGVVTRDRKSQANAHAHAVLIPESQDIRTSLMTGLQAVVTAIVTECLVKKMIPIHWG